MRLAESDARFLYSETENAPLQTNNMILLKGEADFEEIFEFFRQRVHLVPMLRQRLMWVPMNIAHPKLLDDPDFDLRNHVVEAPLEKGTSVDAAFDAAVHANEAMMDRTIPLWKIHVFTGVDGHTLLLQQIHHCLVDAGMVMQISDMFYDKSADAAPPAPEETEFSPPRLPTEVELYREAMAENTKAMMKKSMYGFMPDSKKIEERYRRSSELMQRFLSEPVAPTPWNKGRIGPNRRRRKIDLDFGELKEIRNVFGGTINDVILAVVAEGAARYLEGHGQVSMGKKFRMLCPVSVRSEGESDMGGNRLTSIYPETPASTMDLQTRLRDVTEETQRIKMSGEAEIMANIMEDSEPAPIMRAPSQLVGTPGDPNQWVQRQMGWMSQHGMLDHPKYGPSFAVSNVPGPRHQMFVAGYPVVEYSGMMLLNRNFGYGVGVLSYNGGIHLMMTVDPEQVPDYEHLTDLTVGCYKELLELARAN